MTNFLLEPNVAYLLLMSGIIMGVLALYTPGTGLIEVGALFALGLAIYGFSYNSINLWAFPLLLIGIAPFLLPLFMKRPLKRLQGIAMGIGSFVALLAGSYFLVNMQNNQTGINLLVIALVSAFTAVVFSLLSQKGIEAIHRRPSHDLGRLIGQAGTATTDIFADGSVYAGGEQWSARSQVVIPAGSQVRIVKREGFTLEVELVEQEKPGG